jgi:transposase
VFGWVLRQVTRAGLLKGKTIGIDATTLEANAAMKSIVRRDTEENYTEYRKGLAEAAGVQAAMKRRCGAWTGGGRSRRGMGSG